MTSFRDPGRRAVFVALLSVWLSPPEVAAEPYAHLSLAASAENAAVEHQRRHFTGGDAAQIADDDLQLDGGRQRRRAKKNKEKAVKVRVEGGNKKAAKNKKKKENSKKSGSAQSRFVESCTLPGYERDDGAAEFKFSFTNEFGISVDCDATVEEQTAAVERGVIAYQNQLARMYGCVQEVDYEAAAITDILVQPSSCEEGGARDRRRGLQQIGQRRVNIKYNTLGRCRSCRRPPARSLPPEDSSGGGGRRAAVRGRTLQEDGSRDVFVSTITSSGVRGARGAEVLSERANDCGQERFCNPPAGVLDDGACCGVREGCSCPAVTNSYCGATNCNLPNGACCAFDVTIFDNCEWNSATACLCLLGDCEHPVRGEDCCQYTTCQSRPNCQQ